MTAFTSVVASMIWDSAFDDCRLYTVTAPEDGLRRFRVWIHEHVSVRASAAGLELVFRRGAVGRKQTQDLGWLGEESAITLPAFKRPLDSFILVASNRLVPNLQVRFAQIYLK